MSFLGMFNNVGKGGSRDKNSQTDFDFDDGASDGTNIGIRVDPRGSSAKPPKPEKSRAKTPESNPDKMLMAEKVFYGQDDSDEPWSVNPVNSPIQEEPNEVRPAEKHPRRPVERDSCRPVEKDPCNPCDPCQQYKQCMQQCMMPQDSCEPKIPHVEPEPVEDEKPEVKQVRSGRRSCKDPCRSSSRGREEKIRETAGTTEKPRRQCSDLCRVAKKRQEPVENVNETPAKDNGAQPEPPAKSDPCAQPNPCSDPCAQPDPCADPCQRKDPCADKCADPCANPDPCDDPCADPCQRRDPCAHPPRRKRANQCYDPCKDPCADPCQDPCKELCQDPCEILEPCLDDCEPIGQEGVLAEGGGEAEANAHVDETSAQACAPCPPQCPPCPECPQCPGCPPCPPCPAVASTGNKAQRPCGTSTSSNTKAQSAPVVRETAVAEKAPTEERPQDKSDEENKASEESCHSIVCPEDS